MLNIKKKGRTGTQYGQRIGENIRHAVLGQSGSDVNLFHLTWAEDTARAETSKEKEIIMKIDNAFCTRSL